MGSGVVRGKADRPGRQSGWGGQKLKKWGWSGGIIRHAYHDFWGGKIAVCPGPSCREWECWTKWQLLEMRQHIGPSGRTSCVNCMKSDSAYTQGNQCCWAASTDLSSLVTPDHYKTYETICKHIYVSSLSGLVVLCCRIQSSVVAAHSLGM